MNRITFHTAATALTACAAAALVACGGGNDDPSYNALSAEQAKSLAAGTIHAVLLADHVATLVTNESVGASDMQAGTTDVPRSLHCAAGDGQFVAADADASTTLSVGDQFTYTLAACQPMAGSAWVLDGSPVASVAGGSNVSGMWFDGEDGQFTVKLSANGMRMGGGTSLSGDWRLDTTRSGETVVQVVQFSAATFGSRDMTSQFDGVSFGVDRRELHSLAGQVRTSVLGYGDITATLSQPGVLQLDASHALRHVPNAGTVTVETHGVRMAVVYGELGVVTLQVDEGKDGTVDLEVVTSVAELDGLVLQPAAPAVAVAEEGAGAGLCGATGGEGGSACEPVMAEPDQAGSMAVVSRPARIGGARRLLLPKVAASKPGVAAAGRVAPAR